MGLDRSPVAIRPPSCPRCAAAQVRPLGDAGSDLQWFACLSCSYVWGVPDRPVEDAALEVLLPPRARN